MVTAFGPEREGGSEDQYPFPGARMLTEPVVPLGLSLKVHVIGPAGSVTMAFAPAAIEDVDIWVQVEEVIWWAFESLFVNCSCAWESAVNEFGAAPDAVNMTWKGPLGVPEPPDPPQAASKPSEARSRIAVRMVFPFAPSD
jgi:hypothetical protein